MTREEAIEVVKKNWPDSSYTQLQDALETLIPELAESESEEERILASIADCVGLMGEDGNVFSNHNVTKVQVLSWLKKQKEQKPLKVGENAYFDPNTQMWFIKKEQKSADLSEMMVHKEPYIAPVPTPMVADEQKPADLPAGFYVTLPDGKKYYAKEMRCNGMNVKVVEPKPSEVDESTKRLNDNWMKRHFDDYKERESAEWAEPQSESENIDEAFENGKKEVISNPEKYGLCKRIKATINGEPIPTENQSVDIPLAECNPMKFKEGDKVIIHCAPERAKSIFKIYDGQEGTIDAIWDLGINPWGNIKVILPDGCNNTFYDSELELINKNESKQEWSEDFDKEVENVHKRYPEVSFAKLTRIAYHFSKWANRHNDIEWSEEDEKMRQSIIKDIEFERNYTSAETGKVIEKYNEQINWLKNLSSDFKKRNEAVDKLCSNEWSEEDETAFGDLMWCIKQAAKSAKDENDMGNVWFAENWVKNRLKSLRPQPKREWSEEDEGLIDLAVEAVEDFYNGGIRSKIINLLKSIRPSWKPTKAMLDALNWARSEFHPDCADTMDNLTYLYKELERLYYGGN